MIRLTGMNSGLDTDAMVKELVNAYEKKGQKTKNNKTKHEWKQTIWTDLNKKIKSFNSKVKSMQYTSNYSQKKTVSSNENKVSVIAGDTAVKGTQTIKVTSLAKTAYVTSRNLNTDASGNKLDTAVTSETKLSALGVTSADSKITFTQNGKTTSLDANADTTVGEFVTKLKAAGVDASFDEKNGRIFISAKESGEAGNFSFSGDQTAISALGLSKADVVGKALNLNADGTRKDTAVNGSSKLSDLGIGGEGSSISFTYGKNTVQIDTGDNTTINDVLAKLRSAGADASFDETTGSFKIGGSENFSFSGSQDVIDGLGLKNSVGPSVITGQDASIILNGAEFTSSTNAFDINGMAISVKGLTDEGEELTLSTDVDTDAIYKNIKSLLSEYSKLMNELSKLYNADSARKFDPLTDEEKDAMTDDEVEKWETKIKDSLLRRDDNVAAVMNAMKNATMGSYTVNGKSMTLADFGVGTLSYFAAGENERGALHINGDSDDEAVSGETNKLKQMLTSDPDAVASFFSQLMTDLSDRFNTMSSSTTNRSYGNFYDDKKVKEEMTSYEKKVSDFEIYLADIEDKYYKQFTRMETSLAKLNNTQTQLGNYFG